MMGLTIEADDHGDELAVVLRERGIPFVLAPWYEQWALPEAYKDVPRCDKPVDLRQLARMLFG